MVSGFVTSPWDHDRIFSGEARLIRILSKSAIEAARSYGFVLIKAIYLLAGELKLRGWFLLHQLYVETDTLEFANKHVEGCGDSGLHGRLPLDDGFINLGAAVDVVGL